MKLYNIVNFRDRIQSDKMTMRSRLFVGYLCNIKCKFCFYKGKKHIDIKDIIWQQLEQGKLFGIKDWDISGGEPSILPYWFELLEKMKEMGFRNIACITNGYQFADPEFLKDSMYRGLNELLFSLHGSNKTIHDKMTGVKGSFDKLHDAIANSVRYGIKRRINVVVTKDNYKDLVSIATYANHIKPAAFNFLPFRVEGSASKRNMVRYSEIAPYIKEAIDVLNDEIKIRIRYVPFCIFKGYEEYVAGYYQRVYDEYEWNEYTIVNFHEATLGNRIPHLDCKTEKWKLEAEAINHSIKYVANHAPTCIRCKYLKKCDGIWYSYAKVWGIEEFNHDK